MTKSRTLPTLFLLALFQPLPAAAQNDSQAVTADEAIALDRARMREMLGTDCPPIRTDDEVVVCGRRPDYRRYRVPMSGPDVSRGTRERAADAQLYVMDAGDTRCSAVGRDHMCGEGLDLIGIGFTIVRGIAQALANRD
ncbi:MAG TPA: hypothetical protein VEC11_00645 [Allosphingosinicella sp.]|nr:hypothetical protein [Allosphingosinicella sp.]